MKATSKATKAISILLAGTILLTSCVSTTRIQSIPSGAKIYLNDEYEGETPHFYSDTKIVGSSTSVRLEKEGYETYNGAFSRTEEVDVGAIIGGILFVFPFLWTMGYKPFRTYELNSLSETPKTDAKLNEPQTLKSKADQLRELKKLLDEGIITQEEFEKEKKKILEEKK